MSPIQAKYSTTKNRHESRFLTESFLHKTTPVFINKFCLNVQHENCHNKYCFMFQCQHMQVHIHTRYSF